LFPNLNCFCFFFQPDVVAFSLAIGQSKPIYKAFKVLRESEQWESLTEAQKRIVEGKTSSPLFFFVYPGFYFKFVFQPVTAAEIRDAELSGAALEGEEKTRFNEIQQV
jgi:oligopeptidase A